MQLQDVAVLITGGGSGLGAATARAMAAKGAKIGVLDQSKENAEKVAAEVKGIALHADVTDEEQVKAAIAKDRYAFFEGFLNNFNNVDVLGGSRISDRAWQASFNVAVGASPFASYACVDTWLTDFRADLPKIDVPILVMHGTEDRILPFDSTAARLPALVLWGKLDNYVPIAHGEALHEGIANSEFTAIPNVGHLPHLEVPEECARLMLAFLRKYGG